MSTFTGSVQTMDFFLACSCIDKMIDSFSFCEKFFIDLSGKGEPLLALPLILKIKEHCTDKSNKIRKEILVSFVSNGTLLTQEIADILQKNGILFGISMDGNEYIHNLHRKNKDNKETFSLILDNIKNIKDKTYLGCAITITNDVFDLVDAIKGISPFFNTISIKPVRDSKFGINADSIEGWKNQYVMLAKEIIREAHENKILLLKRLLNGDDYFGKFIYRSFLEIKTLNRCDAGITRYSFDINGKVYGCPSCTMDKKLRIKKINYKKGFIAQIKKNKKECSSCDYYLFCGGACILESGVNSKKNNMLCEFKKHLINLAMYLKIYIASSNKDTYKEIISFCKEKSQRFSVDKALQDFLLSHPSLDYVEGKKLFDSLYAKY